LGIRGALEVECSPWVDDNQWVLDVAADAPVIVGTVGNLPLEEPGFRKDLERFGKNPLFRGIRYGNLWNRDIGKALLKAEVQRGLKDLAAAGLSMDTANPSLQLLADMVRVSDIAPELRIIIDHLPGFYPPSDRAESGRYSLLLRELQQRPAVYAKLSATLNRVNGKKVSFELTDHKERLDLLYETFGPDRVIFGSDWPNSDLSAPYTAVLGVMQAYFRGKGREVAEKYFWRNSAKAYRWVKREPSQPDPKSA
jgi:predicted TIM-barrel fold metal-dependent hydrolase